MCSIPADIFGLPDEGIHSYSLFDLAIVDIIGTVIIAILLANFFDVNVWVIFIALFGIGQLLHYSIGVNTRFLHKIGIGKGPKN